MAHAVAAALAAETVSAAAVAAPPGYERRAGETLTAAGLNAAETTLLGGGETRAASVRAALAAVETELVVIHDAARPLAPPSLFDAVVRRLAADDGLDAVVAAAPIVDTVKRAIEPRDTSLEPTPQLVAETLPRESLWAAQTPQAFRVASLLDAQAEAERSGDLGAATDEARLVELVGGRVLLEPAPTANLKVTTPSDLALAESLLAASGRV